MSLNIPHDQCHECPRCGKRTAHNVDRDGWVRDECDECGYSFLVSRPKGYSIKDAKRMVLRGLV
jgi:ribosomal protein L37AE/L43A